MAKDLNQKPAEGNAALFRKLLAPVMNEAFALVKDTVVLVATRYFNDYDSVDYKYMKDGDGCSGRVWRRCNNTKC